MTSIPYLANNLKRFSNQAKISVSSPVNEGIPWMVNINEFWNGEDSI